MLQLTIYHNKRCSTSRNTLKLIQDSGIEMDLKIVDYLTHPPSYDLLKNILVKLNMKPEQLLRKKEKLFKEKYEGKKFGPEEWIKVMVDNPILIERPIVVGKHKAVIGRPPENVEALLKK